jgi:GNAT superfamily N-acetyltransferase
MTFTIRKAIIDDLNDINEIINLVVPIMNSNNNFQWRVGEYPLQSDFEKDIVNDILWVAIEDNKVIGVAALDHTCPIEYDEAGCDITTKCIVPHRLAVHPSSQGKGVALGLMNKAILLAKENNYKYVRVDTNSLNNKMQNMFTKLAFINKGPIKLIGKPEDQTYLCYEYILD